MYIVIYNLKYAIIKYGLLSFNKINTKEKKQKNN